jgi:hypothetical protein
MIPMFSAIGRRISELAPLSFFNGIKNGSKDPSNNPVRNDANTNKAIKPSPLGDVLSRKLNILKDAIEEIDREIDERRKLTAHFREQIDSEARECKLLLDKLPYPWKQGYQPKTEFIRISLHKSLLTRRKDKRQEELKYWDDLTALMKEKRKLIMEYDEIKDTIERVT